MKYVDTMPGLDNRVVMLPGFFNQPTLYLYSGGVDKYALFSRCIDDGIGRSESCMYAYYHTKMRSALNPLIQNGQVRVLELRDQLHRLPMWIADQRKAVQKSSGSTGLRFVFDFSRADDVDAILHAKEEILCDTDSVPVSGIFAFDLAAVSEELIAELSHGLPRVVVADDHNHILSFAHDPIPIPGIELVEQDTVDEVVKKMLEPLILASLSKPVSGSDILREIHDRFHVTIPMARVYSYLYHLEEKGYLVTRTEGRSKIYIPTPEGEVFIARRTREIHTVLRDITWSVSATKEPAPAWMCPHCSTLQPAP